MRKNIYLYILNFVLLMALSVRVAAQSEITPPEPSAVATDKDGVRTELSAGDGAGDPFEAPLNVSFTAGADEHESFSRVCTWTFMRSDETTPFLTRYDADVDYEFLSAGTYTVSLYVTYTSRVNPEIIYEYECDPFTIIIAESSLKVPNAFSPNGDGINDYFNVYDVKSIVSFHGAIYNRWGQQLFTWGIDEIDCEGCGWDGTYKGKKVKDGVYFVVVTATGADGINYEIKGDVNLLRGYIEESNQ